MDFCAHTDSPFPSTDLHTELSPQIAVIHRVHELDHFNYIECHWHQFSKKREIHEEVTETL